MKTLLEKLEELIGPVAGYDGRYTVWSKISHPNMTRASYDLRDLIPKLKVKGVTLKDLQDAMPEPEKVKRGKVAVPDSPEGE